MRMQINPIISKDLKTKMRGWKAPALVTAYLGFLGLVVFLFFITSKNDLRYGYGIFNPRTMLNAYNTLAILQLGLIMLIVPAMTGGAVSNERERQTMDLLLCTNIRTLSIISGKLFVSLAHILLLITASLPVMAGVFLFGGVSFTDLLSLFAFYLVTALFVGSLGIFYSTVFKKSVVAIVVTYITLGVLGIGTMVALLVWFRLSAATYGRGVPTAGEAMLFLFPNPLYGFASIADSSNLINLFIGSLSTGSGKFFQFVRPWMANIFFDLVAAAGLMWMSARRIMPVKHHRKHGGKRWGLKRS